MRTAVGYWDARGFSLSCEAPRGCQHTFPAMPLFPNNPAPLLKDAAPAAQALQTDLLSKPCSQKSLAFSPCTCPEAQTKGAAIFSCPQTVTAYSLHCFTLFGNTDSTHMDVQLCPSLASTPAAPRLEGTFQERGTG